MLLEGIRNLIDGVRTVTLDIGACVTQRELKNLIRSFALAYADGAFFYGGYIKADTDAAITILADSIASGRKLNVQVSKNALGLVEAYYIGEGRVYQLLSPEQYERTGCPSAAKPCLATGFGNRDEYNEEAYAAYARAKQICEACFEKKGILKKSPQEDPKSSETQESEAAVEENEDYIAPLDSKAQKMYLGLSNEELADKLTELSQAIAAITGNLEEYIKRLDMTEWARNASQEDYDRFVQAMKEQMDSLKGIIDNAREHAEYIRQELEDRKRSESIASPNAGSAVTEEANTVASASPAPANEPEPTPGQSTGSVVTPTGEEQASTAAPSGAAQTAPTSTAGNIGILPRKSSEEPEPPAEDPEVTSSEILQELYNAGYSKKEIRKNPHLVMLLDLEETKELLRAKYGDAGAAPIIKALPDSSFTLAEARQLIADAGIEVKNS